MDLKKEVNVCIKQINQKIKYLLKLNIEDIRNEYSEGKTSYMYILVLKQLHFITKQQELYITGDRKSR